MYVNTHDLNRILIKLELSVKLCILYVCTTWDDLIVLILYLTKEHQYGYTYYSANYIIIHLFIYYIFIIYLIEPTTPPASM